MPNPTIIATRADDSTAALSPTTLRKLGRDESFLEELITKHPELLELDAARPDLRFPYVIFRQQDIINAMDRTIIPDILLFTASGHAIIVEVKLGDNPELRDRKALAQVIDYAAAFIDRTEDELVSIFSSRAIRHNSWDELIASLFPEEVQIEPLASSILRRLQQGEVDLIIACDHAPFGLSKLLSGISRQSALPYALRLVEITPYVDSSKNGNPIFVSRVQLRTDIISRTAVTVRYEEGSVDRPSVQVETTSVDDIEEHMKAGSESRYWSDAEISDAVDKSEATIVKRLYDMAQNDSIASQIQSVGKKRSPSFGFYLRKVDADGVEFCHQVFNYRIGATSLVIYLNMIEARGTKKLFDHFVSKLTSIFPLRMAKGLREPWFMLEEVEARFDEFRQAILELQEDSLNS
jgi:hypothetical protein